MTRDCPILLLEDDENDAWLFKRALAKLEIRNPIRVVTDGEQGIAYLAGEGRYGDRTIYPLPCFIITDLKMPKRGGLEVLEWLSERPEMRVVPTLVLTSSKEQADVSRAYGYGASSYMVKPTDFQDLEKLVRLMSEYWDACEKPA